MKDIIVIENKISSIKKYQQILQRYIQFLATEIENDIDIRGALERYLYLICQSCIDLAEATIAYKNFRRPGTMSDAFIILNENQIISSELLEKMRKMVGFRNILAHDYEEINYDYLYDILHNGMNDIEEFVKIISDLP